jgi:hypothetical protein
MATTRYYRIAPKIWRHAKVHRWDGATCTLALYLLTCPHRNIAGLFVLPRAYIGADLPLAPDDLDRAWAQLLAEDFIRYDAATDVVLLVNALAYDAPENANQCKGAAKALTEVPATPLWRDLLAQARRYAPALGAEIARQMQERFPQLMTEPMDQRLPEPLPERLPKPFDEPFPEPIGEPIGERNANSVSVTVTVPVTVAATSAHAPAPEDAASPPDPTAPTPADAAEDAEDFVCELLHKVQLTGAERAKVRQALAWVPDLARFKAIATEAFTQAQARGVRVRSFGYLFAHFEDLIQAQGPPPPRAAPRRPPEPDRAALYAEGYQTLVSLLAEWEADAHDTATRDPGPPDRAPPDAGTDAGGGGPDLAAGSDAASSVAGGGP